MQLKKDIQALLESINTAIELEINLEDTSESTKQLTEFKERKKDYAKQTLIANIKKVQAYEPDINNLIKDNPDSPTDLLNMIKTFNNLSSKDLNELKQTAESMSSTASSIKLPDPEKDSQFTIPKNIPTDIKSDISADIKEMDKCFSSECYRSAVILCGRILETALHRKYYDATGIDVLEKNPGIGLGNLIAKLHEKGVKLDPALPQQIHLINQARVFSVHKKQEAFYPTQSQTQAIILYTLDVLEKMFALK